MINLDYEIQVEKITDWVSLWFFGDKHIGARACAMGEIIHTRDQIKNDPNSYAVETGDFCDFVNYSDPRFDPTQVAIEFLPHLDKLAEKQAECYVALHRPIADKMVCAIPGNHDDKIRVKYHFDVAGYICGALSVPLLSAVAQLRLRVTDGRDHSYMVKGAISHSEKAAVTATGKLAAAERMADFYGNHDFFAQAHTHEYMVHDARGLDVAGEFQHRGSPRTVERPRMVFLTGGYLKTYAPGTAGYGEKRGYRPCKLGSPRLKMRLNRTTDKVELTGE